METTVYIIAAMLVCTGLIINANKAVAKKAEQNADDRANPAAKAEREAADVHPKNGTY